MKTPRGWTEDTLYILGDNLRYDHPAKKIVSGSNIWKAIDYVPTPSNGFCVRAIWNGEKRAPKKGEWYLSGPAGFVRAYKASNDLTGTGDDFFIASIVVVEMKTIQTKKIIVRY